MKADHNEYQTQKETGTIQIKTNIIYITTEVAAFDFVAVFATFFPMISCIISNPGIPKNVMSQFYLK